MTKDEALVQLALGTLSVDERVDLARSRKTSRKVLAVLADDDAGYVRSCVLRNSNTSGKTLHYLVTDKFGGHTSIRDIRDNPNLWTETLEWIHKHTLNMHTKYIVNKILKVRRRKEREKRKEKREKGNESNHCRVPKV